MCAPAEADIILTCYGKITPAIIASAPRLRGIVKYGVGIDAINIAAAKERRIPVVNIPEYASQTVAEGAVLLMLGLSRRLPRIEGHMRTSGWAWPADDVLGHDLGGRTLGLVGFGQIARAVARIANGFGMTVLATDPRVSAETMREHGVAHVAALPELLGAADIVSLHATLSDTSMHLLGAAELRAMRPSTVLINVSRGELVDEAALLAALQSGALAGAGLDVYSQEPLARTGHPLSPLFAMENVMLLPHLTFYTHEAMHRLEVETVDRLEEMIAGRPSLVLSRDPRLVSQKHNVAFP